MVAAITSCQITAPSTESLNLFLYYFFMDDIIDFIVKMFWYLLCIVGVGLFLIAVMALVVDYHYFQKAIGVISQDQKTRYVQDIIKEEG